MVSQVWMDQATKEELCQAIKSWEESIKWNRKDIEAVVKELERRGESPCQP